MWKMIKDWWMSVKEWFISLISVPEDIVDTEEIFIKSLEEKGFLYIDDQDWWQRIWTTKTRDAGEESCLEVYKKNGETEEWSSIMYGSEGELFFEENLGKK